MPRTFDGTNDSLHTSTGALSAMTWGTFVAVLKRNGTAYHNVMSLHTSGGVSKGGMEIEDSSSNKVTYQYNTVWVLADTITVVNADGWVLIAMAKASSGTTAVRASKYVYSTNAWTHENGVGTATNFTAVGAGTMRFGEWEAGDDFAGDLAVAGVWSGRYLSDAEVESLAFSLRGWHSSNPTALWVFDQSLTTQSLADLTGGGANESALTGTTVSTNSVPVFGYGHEPMLASLAPTAATITGEAALVADAALAADAHLEIPGAAALAADAGLAAAAQLDVQAAAALVADAALAAAAQLDVQAAAALAADGSLAADAHLEIASAAALAADAALAATAQLEVLAAAALAADASLTAAALEALEASLVADADLTGDAEVVARDLDWQWYGSLVFTSEEERDRGYERISDFVQATQGTEPHPDSYYGTGLEKQTTGHVGDSEGPGFTWSYRVVDALIHEAQVLSGDIQDYALDGQSGTAQLED